MGPTWVLSAPDGPHVGPMNLAIREAKMVILICSQIAYLLGLCKGTAHGGLWKMVEMPTNHVSLQSIVMRQFQPTVKSLI